MSSVLIALDSEFHLSLSVTPPDPTILIEAGDTLRLVIQNWDTVAHTFTFPHFKDIGGGDIDVPLPPGSPSNPTQAFVNFTSLTQDRAKWQFWCAFHSAGPDDESHSGMVGWVDVTAPALPPAPGAGLAVIIGTVVAVVAIVGVGGFLLSRRRKKS